ncbi:MAG TPA: hypothetical protein VGJ44_00310, partial [Kribbellaceae bacterium]
MIIPSRDCDDPGRVVVHGPGWTSPTLHPPGLIHNSPARSLRAFLSGWLRHPDSWNRRRSQPVANGVADDEESIDMTTVSLGRFGIWQGGYRLTP